MVLTKLIKPIIKITDLKVDRNVKKEDIEKMISDQNPVIDENGQLYEQFLKDIKYKDNSTVFAEVDGSLLHKIMT